MDTSYFRKLLAAPSLIKNFSFSRQYTLNSRKPQSLCEIPHISGYSLTVKSAVQEKWVKQRRLVATTDRTEAEFAGTPH